MTAIRLLLPRGNLRRWHRALGETLIADGNRVYIGLRAGANAPPPSIALIETLERLLYGRGDIAASDLLAPGQWSPDEATDEADLVFDLTGAPDVAPNAIAPLYDGAPGEMARDAALLAGRAPNLQLARMNGAGWEVLANARPAIERQKILASGRDALANRTVTLARQLARRGPRAFYAAAPALSAPRAPMRFLRAELVDLARRRLTRLVARDGHWRIGLRAMAPGQSAYAAFSGPQDESWRWLPDDRRRYFADPFLFEDNGTTYVFCEEYPYAARKGVIAMFTLDAEGNAGAPRIALERPYHLSYPNVFRHAGQIWMMPESSQAGTLEVYRADPFPTRWILDRVVLRDVAISDATAFHWKGEWFLTGATNEPGTSSWDCLSLYGGPGPLGPWTPLGDGPALIDASAARPAGNVFQLGGDSVRPAQDCSGSYGSGLAFCRIDEVGPDVFGQTPLRRFAPPTGVHTFNFTDRHVAIDAVGARARHGLFDKAGRR